MKGRRRFLHALVCALTLWGVACGQRAPARREYALKGQILSVTVDRLEASIKHEEISGFMAAMTMPYKVKDVAELAGVAPGDLITATLVVVTDGAHLERVTKVGQAPLDQTPPQTLAAPTTSGFELLKPGEPVPDVAFVNQDGATVRFASLQGTPLVVTFIYTRCPLPTFCPLMDQHFAALQARLNDDPALATVRLVSVSFDPATDTPEVLKRHATRLGADPNRWMFLTGDRDEVDRFAARFGVALTRNLQDPTDITHNLRTALVDAKGRLVKAYTGNQWTPADVLRDVTAHARAQG